MKTRITYAIGAFLLLVFVLALTPGLLHAQTPQAVQKLSGSLTQGFHVPSGVTIDATGTGAISATSVTGLSVAAGKTLTASNTLTFTGTDGSSVAFGTGGTVLYSGGSYVSSLAGTSNEIAASASTGAVTLSLSGPHAFSTLTSTALLLGAGTSAITPADLTYVSPTLTVPDAFAISSAGSIALTAGGSNKSITLKPSGTGTIAGSFNASGISATTLSGYVVTGADSGDAGFSVEAYTAFPYFIGRRANGTFASPSAVTSGGALARFGAEGYGTAFTSVTGYLGFTADENWSGSANGTRVSIYTTTNEGTTGSVKLTINNYGRSVWTPVAGSLAAWGTTGALNSFGGITITDSSSSGTVATAVANNFGVPTFAASSATTFTNAANLYIAGDVAAGTNVTLTNSYGLWNAGKTRLDGAVQLPSTNTLGVQLYNTADQTTNYERAELLWSANSAILRTDKAGSGTSRPLFVYAVGGGTATFRPSGNTLGMIQLSGVQSAIASAIAVNISGMGSTATSGGSVMISLTPTYNQASGTAANTDLLINRTETAVGSGAQLLADFQVASTSKFKVANTGAITTVSTITTLGGATFHTTSSALTDGAGVALGTLATAPSAGNPTKWLGINDNGTTRYIPAW